MSIQPEVLFGVWAMSFLLILFTNGSKIQNAFTSVVMMALLATVVWEACV